MYQMWLQPFKCASPLRRIGLGWPHTKNPGIKPGFAGANGRTRTGDLLITSEPLYQLSYVGVAYLNNLARHFTRSQVSGSRAAAAGADLNISSSSTIAWPARPIEQSGRDEGFLMKAPSPPGRGSGGGANQPATPTWPLSAL